MNPLYALLSLVGAVVLPTGANFNDALLGQLSPSDGKFPFLQSTASSAVLIYPNGPQVLQLQSDAQHDQRSSALYEDFNKFDTYRRFLSDFLIVEYERREPMKIPNGIQVKDKSFYFTALIVNENELDSLASVIERARGTGSNRLPRAEVASEIRTCLDEQFGNAATNNYKELEQNRREITRHRVNCRKIKDIAFVSIGTVHMVYQILRPTTAIDENFIRDRVYEFSDYKLRETVFEDFRYPYLLPSPNDYWLQPTTPATPGRIHHGSLLPRLQRMIEGSEKIFFEGELDKGKEIVVKGTPSRSKNRFSVNLATGKGVVLLHISVRFDESTPVVVRNTFYDGKWQDEERQGGFPFSRNEAFEIKISSGDSSYEIMVNGQTFATYNYRLDPSMVRTVWIWGDVADLVVADVF